MREALAYDGPTGPCVRDVFASFEAADRYPELRDAARGVEAAWHLVDDEALAALTGNGQPPGSRRRCATSSTYRWPTRWPRHRTWWRSAPTCVTLATPARVIRCADAAGAGLVVLAGESVDPYNGKAVRASVGSLFHVPVVTGVTVTQAVEAVRDAGILVLAADGAGDVDVDELLDGGDLAGRTAWMFGNEAWGLPATTAGLADAVVRLPIYGRAESLNLATAAAICLYTTAREQRRGRTAR